MRATAVILQHQDDAPAGLLVDVLNASGLRWQTVRLDRGESLPDPDSVALAVTLGSEHSAHDMRQEWIAPEIDWLRQADDAGTVIFGVCFGAQALALALGGAVERACRPERGWVQISTALPALVAPGPWLAWHDDAILLPPGAELLAHNGSGPQAFRAGPHLGVQFHPEVTPEIVAGWVLSERTGRLDTQDRILIIQRLGQHRQRGPPGWPEPSQVGSDSPAVVAGCLQSLDQGHDCRPRHGSHPGKRMQRLVADAGPGTGNGAQQH